jgi:tripartite-type tricarboxylate transporter receptor subunit TctC
MMQAKPDGYTIMQAENAALLFNEHMFAKLPYKPASDFTYIGTIGRFPVALVVHPDFPAKNVAEFVRYVKANPDKVSYASPGNGSPHHMAMELFKQKAGLTITHVPYKGAAPAMTDVLGGQVPGDDAGPGLGPADHPFGQGARAGHCVAAACERPARGADLCRGRLQ